MIWRSNAKFARGSTEKSTLQTSKIISRQNTLTLLSFLVVPVVGLFPVEQASELIVETFTENSRPFLLRYPKFRLLIFICFVVRCKNKLPIYGCFMQI